MNSSRLSPWMDSSCLTVWAQASLSLVSVSMNTLCTGGWTYHLPVPASWELGYRWIPHPTRVILIGPQDRVKPSTFLFTASWLCHFLKSCNLPSWINLTISLIIPCLLNKVLWNIFSSVFIHHDLKTGELNPGSYLGEKRKWKRKGWRKEKERKGIMRSVSTLMGFFFSSLLKIQVPCNLGNKCFHPFSFPTGQLDLFPGIWCQEANLMSGKLHKIENSVVA